MSTKDKIELEFINMDEIDGGNVASQSTLAEYMRIKTRLDKLKETIRNHLENGGTFEEGPFKAVLRKSESRRPKWKDILIEQIGKKKVKKIIDKTEPTEYTRLDIRPDTKYLSENAE